MQLDRSRLLGLAAVLAVAGLAVWFWPGSAQTPEEHIRQRVEEMAEAAGQRDVAFIMEQISERFSGQGGADKSQLKGLIVAQVFRGEWVEVMPTALEVQLESPQLANFDGKFVFARKAGLDLAAAAQAGGLTAYQIQGQLQKEADGEWRFINARHQQVEARDLF